MTENSIGGDVARLLFESGAIHVNRSQPFILAAGWASPVYIDMRLLLGDLQTRRKLTDLGLRYIDATFPPGSFDAMAGAETAGIPLAAWIADRAGVKFRYVRKRPLGVGRHSQVECGSVNGMRVLLIDDLTTDGASKVKFLKGLRAAGAVVEHSLSMFCHKIFPGLDERMKANALSLHSLGTWDDIIAHGKNAFPPQDWQKIVRFVVDPVGWSLRHGGRASSPSKT